MGAALQARPPWPLLVSSPSRRPHIHPHDQTFSCSTSPRPPRLPYRLASYAATPRHRPTSNTATHMSGTEARRTNNRYGLRANPAECGLGPNFHRCVVGLMVPAIATDSATPHNLYRSKSVRGRKFCTDPQFLLFIFSGYSIGSPLFTVLLHFLNCSPGRCKPCTLPCSSRGTLSRVGGIVTYHKEDYCINTYLVLGSTATM
ncbi:hypothetical protein PHLGIDRAFT_213227 [Phlebiopsis gigantea 11061_1 CR5-6]|uniref:Uncharacterized protein n=1 Tax=Phlebiopsis gigantea (strain 11061_1 CR5-6) TaxID=745531 RepID=A0A0C3S2T4_PHLG1|nr:hypothetical protein PHLGIDRAFT_213227 [Phlebiopsis gigantea 11061_1 CR5-6]